MRVCRRRGWRDDFPHQWNQHCRHYKTRGHHQESIGKGLHLRLAKSQQPKFLERRIMAMHRIAAADLSEMSAETVERLNYG